MFHACMYRPRLSGVTYRYDSLCSHYHCITTRIGISKLAKYDMRRDAGRFDMTVEGVCLQRATHYIN